MSYFKKSLQLINETNAKGRLIRLYILGAISGVMQVVIAVLFSPVISYLQEGEYRTFGLLACLLVTLSTANVFLQRFVEIERTRVAYIVEEGLSGKYMDNLDRVHVLGIQAEIGDGQWQTLITEDINKLSMLVTGSFYDVVSLVFKFVAAAVFGVFVSFKLTVFIVVFSFLSGVLPKFFNNKIYESQDKINQANDESNNTVLSILSSLVFIKGASKEEYIAKFFDRKYQDYNKKRLDQSYVLVLYQSISSGLSSLLTASWIAYAFYLMSKGGLDLAGFLGFMVLSNHFTGLFTNLPYYTGAITASLPSFERLENLLGYGFTDEITELSLSEPVETIELRNVDFSYNEAGKVLEDFSYEFSKETYLLKAGSGGGKSTLFKILSGIYPVDKGEILVNGKKVTDYRSLGSLVTYVPQDYLVFDMSLRDNLTLKESFTDEQIKEVIDKASLVDFVEGLPEGLDTILGEGLSQNISEGQKQRIALARNLLHKKDVILLDEPTASLDPTSEKKVLETINDINDKVVVMTTHRYTDYIDDMDLIKISL